MASNSSLRLKFLSRIPSRLTGTNGVKVTKDALDFVVSPDTPALVIVPSIAALKSTFFQVYDADQDGYARISGDDLLQNIQDVIIGPNLTGIDALTVGANKVPYYLDNAGNASSYSVSEYVRTVSASADETAFLAAIGAATNEQGALAASALQPDDVGTAAYSAATDFATAAQGDKADSALQPAYNYISRAGNYLGIGQQADFDGFGKGGIYLGGGDPARGTGSYITLDGLRNWISVQSAKADNPTEFIIYGSSAQGYAQCVVGGGNITRLYGSNFRADMVGNTFYFLRKKFKVGAFISANSVTLTELDGSPVNFPINEIEAFNYNYTTGDGVCSIVGDKVNWVSGDPFVPPFFRDFKLVINGVVRTVLNFISPKQWQLTAAPGDVANVPFSWRGDIFDQLSTLRVQAIQGAEEENVNIYTVAGQDFYGRYSAFRAGTAGQYAKSRPIFIGSGEYGPYLPRDQIGVYPNGGPGGGYGNGYVSLGGVQGLEALRVYNPPDMTTTRNRIEIHPAPTGFAQGLRARGVDANVNLYFDTQGTGYTEFSSGSFGRANFRIYGSPGADHLCVDAANAEPYLGAEGGSTNIDIRVIPKGTGRIKYGTFVSSADAPIVGSIEIKDAAGNIRKVAIIA